MRCRTAEDTASARCAGGPLSATVVLSPLKGSARQAKERRVPKPGAWLRQSSDGTRRYAQPRHRGLALGLTTCRTLRRCYSNAFLMGDWKMFEELTDQELKTLRSMMFEGSQRAYTLATLNWVD